MQYSGNPHGKSIDYNENPFIVIWEVTRACQLKCVHCRAETCPFFRKKSVNIDILLKCIVC